MLLPGANLTSLSWLPNVAALGTAYTLYVVDTLGEIGMSTAEHTLPNAAANVRWLCELLDELELTDAHFAGTSRGGWLALQLAAEAPDRVRTATAVDPPGLVPFGLGWYAWLSWFAIRSMSSSALGGPELGPYIAELFRTLPYYRMRVRSPELITDAQLERTAVPTRVLLGERSALGACQKRAARAALLPNATVEIIDGAAHDFPLHQPALVTARITETCRN